MHRFNATWGVCVMLFVGCANATAKPIEPFKLFYDVKLSGFKLGGVTAELRKNGQGHYVYEKSAKANRLARLFVSDSISERSEWKYVNGQLQALRFDSREIDGDEEKREKVVFDWSTNKISMTWKDQIQLLSAQPQVLDRLTLELRMIMDVRADSKSFDYQVAEKGRIKARSFIPQGSENIELPAGTFNTVIYRLVRSDSATKKRSTIFWLAPELDYLPVRMEHHEKKDGYVVTLELRKAHYSRNGIEQSVVEDVIPIVDD